MGLPAKATITAFQGDFGIIQPEYKYYIQIAKLYNRLVKMPNERIVKKVFLWDVTQEEDSWFKELCALCIYLDYPYSYDISKCIDVKQFTECCKSKQESEWKNAIQLKPKLRTYCLFKEVYTTEHYVKYIDQKCQRSLMSQIRSGVLPLQIEVGRYHNIPLDNRTCQVCNTGVIEDEFHFVCICPHYTRLRNVMYESAKKINDNFEGLDDKEKFIFLFKHSQMSVSRYIRDAWYTRKSILYT